MSTKDVQGYAKQAIGRNISPQPAYDMQTAELNADKSKKTRAQRKAAKARRRHAKQAAADEGVGLYLQHEICTTP